MKYLTLIIITFFLSNTLIASGLEGYVYNKSGEPLIGATVYVERTGQGAVTNADGYYVILLPEGEQKVIFQYLGYETLTKTVVIPPNGRTKLDVTLQEQSFRLPELEITGSDKELANAIMRKAIAKAKYHRLQVDKYKVTMYVKGTGRLKKSPGIFRKQLKEEGIDSTMAFTSEAVEEITYNRPNKYDIRVISIYEQGNANNTSPSQMLKASFYDENVAGDKVSPLSQRAFAYYKFNLEGYFLDRGYGVNKIKVTPRSRGENVFEGYIYILEDYWSIHSLELSFYSFGLKVDISQIYAPVKDEVWMPLTQKFIINGKFFGFAFEYIYNAVASDYDIVINPDLDASFAIVDNKNKIVTDVPAAELPKNASPLEKLNAEKELTRKDLRKILRQYEKEERRNTKEKEIVYEETFVIDSLATKKDSAYWATIRPIPLTKYEIRGYTVLDSIATVEKEAAEEEKITGQKARKKKNDISFFDLFTGTTYKFNKHSAFYTQGLMKGLAFNPVEGYSLRERLSFSHSKNGNRQTIYWQPRYAFAPKKLFMKGRIQFDFKAKIKERPVSSSVYAEGGDYIYQYKESGAINEWLNAFENLILERNYIHLFGKKYAKIGYFRNSDKWNLNTSFELAQRNTLRNATTQTFWNREDRDYGSNIPVNEETALPIDEEKEAAVFSVSIEGKPWIKYSRKNGNKRISSGSSASLGVLYRKGIPKLLNSTTDFDFLEVWFKKDFKVRAGTLLSLKVNAGMFLNNQSLGFVDFKHFEGNRLSLTTIDPVNSFRLLDYYQFSTQDKFLTLKAHYRFRKFMLTRIPAVWKFGIKEGLFANALQTPHSDNYWEAGYAIENIFHFLRIEVAASFQGNQYRDWGILIGVSSAFGKEIGISF